MSSPAFGASDPMEPIIAYSAYWHADRPHRIRNAGRAEVRTIAVVTPAAW